MERNRAYRRFQRRRTIRRKKGVSRRVYGMDWFQGVDRKYSKGHIGCGCGLCKPDRQFRCPSWHDAKRIAKWNQDVREYKNREY